MIVPVQYDLNANNFLYKGQKISIFNSSNQMWP